MAMIQCETFCIKLVWGGGAMLSTEGLNRTAVSMYAFILKNVNWEKGNGIQVVSATSFFHHNDNIVAPNVISFIIQL